MSSGRPHPAWEELGRIDFFLEHLARAVERGEAPRETYDTLAPRYLARREELALAIERSAGRAASAAAPAPAPAPAPASGPVAAPVSIPLTATVPGHAPGPAAAPPMRKDREVRWTQVLAYTGAFLVVVAAAIFTVAVWETVSTTAKLLFLGGFTAAFYTAGALVWRSGLHGGGVALTAVASAMLLFDGWIAIDGYGLTGPWPWAVLLLLLSAVYWLTETRLAGRFFGATGAAAQVGWWWLLGQGLGWTPAPRLAGIAAVALVWSLAAGAVGGRKEFSSLASVLRFASPLVAAAACFGVLADLAIGPVRWAEVASAAIVGIALTAIVDRYEEPWRGLAAAGWLPLLAAIASMTGFAPSAWGHLAVLALAALALGAYESYRGGAGHGVAALIFELAAWLVLADLLGFPADATSALLAVVAVTWLVASRLVAGRPGDEPLAPHAANLGRIAAVGGWLLLGGVTLLLPATLNEAWREGWSLPLPRAAVLAAVVTVGWAAAARSMRAWPGAVIAAAGSFVTVALLTEGLLPDLHLALHGCLLAVLAAVWLHLPRIAEGLSAPFLPRAVSWFAGAGLILFAVALWFSGPVFAEWPVFALLIAVAALWSTDAVRHSAPESGIVIMPVIVAAAVHAGDIVSGGGRVLASGAGGVAGAGVGALACAFVLLAVRSRPASGMVALWVLPAALGASAAALWPGLAVVAHGAEPAEIAVWTAVGCLLATLAWLLGTLVLRAAWLLAPAGASLWLACVSVFVWLDVGPAVALAVLSLLAAALFAPTLLLAPDRSARALATAVRAPLAVVALAVAGVTVGLGAISESGIPIGSGWTEFGPWGLAFALALLGVLLVLSAHPYRFEVAEYAGAFALVCAGWVVLGAADVTVIEPYLVLLALYVAASSYRYASRTPERTVPVAADWAAVACAAWIPALLAISAGNAADAFLHSLWAVGLSCAVIAAGIVGRVRGYLFGGVAAIVSVAAWRSLFLLVEFWWAVLGIIGIAMLVIALTWERQQLLLLRTGRIVREYFGGWR